MANQKYKDLAARVEAAGDVLSLEMGELRDVNGSGKLGVHVVAGIVEELEGVGLGAWPANLPTDQWQKVRVFRKGTQVARIIAAVQKCDEENDKTLRRYADRDRAERTLRKIRELLDD